MDLATEHAARFSLSIFRPCATEHPCIWVSFRDLNSRLNCDRGRRPFHFVLFELTLDQTKTGRHGTKVDTQEQLNLDLAGLYEHIRSSCGGVHAEYRLFVTLYFRSLWSTPSLYIYVYCTRPCDNSYSSSCFLILLPWYSSHHLLGNAVAICCASYTSGVNPYWFECVMAYASPIAVLTSMCLSDA